MKQFFVSSTPDGYVVCVTTDHFAPAHIYYTYEVCNFGNRQTDAMEFVRFYAPEMPDTRLQGLIKSYKPGVRYRLCISEESGKWSLREQRAENTG